MVQVQTSRKKSSWNPFRRNGDGPQASTGDGAHDLSSFFNLVGVDDEGPVRSDGKRVVIVQMSGVEITQPNVGAFAGLLNTIDYPIQFYIRQHAPLMRPMVADMRAKRPDDLPDKVDEAADSLENMLIDVEQRDEIVDRRFYAICDEENFDQFVVSLASLRGVDLLRLDGEHLRRLLASTIRGQSPTVVDLDEPVTINTRRSRHAEVSGRFRRSFVLTKWPRAISASYLPDLLSIGLPMDVSIFVAPIGQGEATSKLEWQKTKMDSDRSMNITRGRAVRPETEIAINDIDRLRDAIQRGTERLFNVAVVGTVHGASEEGLDSRWESIIRHFTSSLGKVHKLRWEQQQALSVNMPLNYNVLGGVSWSLVDTSSVARMFPYSPPSLDQRRGTLMGFDMRARSPITYDMYDGTWLNMNKAVLARSGAGKSFSTKLDALRLISRGVPCYIIDPEGEYVDMTLAAGGRVFTPGVPGQGMNPFAVDNMAADDFYARIQAAVKLLQVMIRQPLNAAMSGSLDRELTRFFETNRNIAASGQGKQRQFLDFVNDLNESDLQILQELGMMLSPFTHGSMRHLLTSEGEDLLANEKPVTTFSLTSIGAEMRPVAAMVCANTVWALATSDPKPRRVIVDEVWTMMQHQEGAEFMLDLSKRARKHILGLTVITQDIQDMLSVNTTQGISGNSGRAMLQNAQFKLLLQQDPAVIHLLVDTFDLTNDTARYLTQVPRGGGLLICQGGQFPIHIEATPEETEFVEWAPGRHGIYATAREEGGVGTNGH